MKGQTVMETANPNVGGKKNMKVKDLGEPVELTRREREEIEKKRKEDAYRKKHAEGQTDEYKADMARLEEARKRRLQAQEKQLEETKVSTRVESDDDDSDDEKLDTRTVKAMKPAQLKDALKARGLSTQGQKKDLIDRLLATIK